MVTRTAPKERSRDDFASLAAVVVLLITIAVHPGSVSAHGGASLAVTPASAAPGDKVQVEIKGYEDGTLISVTLEGINGSVPLSTVTADADGSAMTTVMIPDGVKPGSYTVKAVGGDDDATADLSIKASAITNTSATTNSSTMSDGGSGAAPASATAGGESITYKQPTAQWVGIALAAFVAALAGFALVLRREPHA